MKKNIFLILGFALMLSSCMVIKTNTNKTMDIYGAGVIQKPVLVDLDVKETKVVGTATASQNISVEIVKQEAVTDALKKSNADVLVEPKFETVTSAGKTTATVTGFPATYKNFRPVTADDVKLMDVGITQKASVYEQPKTQPKKGGVGAIVGTVTGILLIILLVTII